MTTPEDSEIVFVCCTCDPNACKDQIGLLHNRDCDLHGPTWHRPMRRLADGTLTLAYPN